MLQQFQKVLLTPKPSEQTYMKRVQDIMLNTMEKMMPQDFDFGELAKIFQNEGEYDNLASLTLKLTQYFINIIQENFINLHSYFGLEEQTQKLQSTVRGHIKMEQQMKMYLEHLQYKIERYEYHLQKLRRRHIQNLQSSNQLKQDKERDNIEQLKKRQTQLLKERLILLRKVDYLQRLSKDQEVELRRLNSPTSSTIQQIKQGLYIKEKLHQDDSKPIAFNGNTNISQNPNDQKLLGNQNADRRLSSFSLGSDHQITQKKSSLTASGIPNYKIYTSTGRQNSSQLYSNHISMLESNNQQRQSQEKIQTFKHQGVSREKDKIEQEHQEDSSKTNFAHKQIQKKEEVNIEQKKFHKSLDRNSPIDELIKVEE